MMRSWKMHDDDAYSSSLISSFPFPITAAAAGGDCCWMTTYQTQPSQPL